MIAKPRTEYFKKTYNMYDFAAKLIANKALTKVKTQGFLSLVLSGGKTPAGLYERLAASPFIEKIPWNKIYIFWGDERLVPRNDKNSNFKTAFDNMLSRVPLPEENIFPAVPAGKIKSGAGTEIADGYEKQIMGFFARHRQQAPSTPPSFDLILLGMGNDGHTASLFPGSESLKERKKLVRYVIPPPTATPAIPRISMSYPLINSAENIIFMICGEEKRHICASIISGKEQNPEKIPAAGIRQTENTLWLIS